METDTDLAAGATDRRTALKKAAAAAGVVAWTTPAVQVLSSGTAHAQTVTGCRPMLTVSLAETGTELRLHCLSFSRSVAATTRRSRR